MTIELAPVPTPSLVKHSIAINLLDNWAISKYMVKYVAALLIKEPFILPARLLTCILIMMVNTQGKNRYKIHNFFTPPKTPQRYFNHDLHFFQIPNIE